MLKNRVLAKISTNKKGDAIVEINGSKTEQIASLSAFVKALLDNGYKKQEILMAIDYSFMEDNSKEKLIKAIKENNCQIRKIHIDTKKQNKEEIIDEIKRQIEETLRKDFEE